MYFWKGGGGKRVDETANILEAVKSMTDSSLFNASTFDLFSSVDEFSINSIVGLSGPWTKVGK
jgi:hypothetical protein